jgi:TPR repeat protein
MRSVMSAHKRLKLTVLVLLASSLAIAALCCLFGLQIAEFAISTKNYALAAPILKSFTRANNAKAAVLLGKLYAYGRGVPRDYVKARQLFEKAATAGDLEGMCRLANLLGNGLGGETDEARAVSLVQEAAERGFAKGQYYMGCVHMLGIGKIKRDYDKAIRLLQLSAKDGYGDAEIVLSEFYKNGWTMVPQPEKAKQLLRLARAHECAIGEGWLGEVYLYGYGQPIDVRKAFYWTSEAAAHGNDRALSTLALMYADAKGVPHDSQKAVRLFLEAHEKGDPFAKRDLATRYVNGRGVSKNLTEAGILFEDAEKLCNCGYGEYWLGKAYMLGTDTPQDYVKARYWMSKSAAKGWSHAMNDLGTMYYQGYGGAVDEAKAIDLFLQGARGDCPYAKYTVAERYRLGDNPKLPKDLKKAKQLYEESAKLGNKAATEKLKLFENI